MDNRAEVYSVLTSVIDSVDYRYPVSLLDDDFPKVCYYTSNTSDAGYVDNFASMVEIETTVQIYEKNIEGDMVEIHEEVINAMRQAGFKKIYFDNYYDTDDKTHLYTVRFSKIYDIKGEDVNE